MTSKSWPPSPFDLAAARMREHGAWYVGDHIELSKQLQARKVNLVAHDQNIDTSTPMGEILFHILGAVAQFEAALASERTKDGLAAARARGRTGGQKPKLGPRQVKLARQMYDETDAEGKRRYTVAQIAAEFGVTRPTVYRYLERAASGT
ncbi:MAG: recombinase family protein [Pseudonocardiaceae bacterium]